MPIPLSQLREFQDQRVLMRFDDDHECMATLLNASQDMDGSLHLVYDKVEWANDPRELATSQASTVYAEGESLLHIERLASLPTPPFPE
jgi:hypothetical protein